MAARELLGVAPGAPPGEVRAAFRRFVAVHHPDRGGDPDHFRAGLEAYRQLTGGPTAPAVVVAHRRPPWYGRPWAWWQHQRRARRRPRRVT